MERNEKLLAFIDNWLVQHNYRWAGKEIYSDGYTWRIYQSAELDTPGIRGSRPYNKIMQVFIDGDVSTPCIDRGDIDSLRQYITRFNA